MYVWLSSTALFLVVSLLLTLGLGSSAVAQRLDGTLRVVVSDVSGAAVTDAKVTVTNEGTNVRSRSTHRAMALMNSRIY
jgi:hypothetical protein